MNRILITGAQGFAASYLIRELLGRKWEVFGTRREHADKKLGILSGDEEQKVRFFEKVDLRDRASIRQVFQEEYDYIVHLAGVSKAEIAQKYPGMAWWVNVGGTHNLLQALIASGQRPITLFVSSLEVYGEGHEPAREDIPPVPVSEYAATKLGAESVAFSIARQHDLPLLIARPGVHVGPQAGGLIHKWIGDLEDGKKEVEFGDPAGVREILNVQDVVKAYLLLLEKGKAGEAYNIAAGLAMTFAHWFKVLSDVMGKNARLVEASGPRSDWHLKFSVGEGSKLKAQTGWVPEWSVQNTFASMLKT